jgi:peptidoglycan/xylan/chitin deacetylase (PgdA/CDA1 family)
MNPKQFFILVSLLMSYSANSAGAVILQYHHVSDSTPPSTSISPQQFNAHLGYLKENGFSVVPLSVIVEAIKTKTPLADKTVAITFDDAYLDILTQAKPLLDKFNYPFSIFINPSIVQRKSKHYLTWKQLKKLADDGVIIANHGFDHHSLARINNEMSEQQWLTHYGQLLEKSEAVIKEKTGQSWRYFAYPYGEYSKQALTWLKQLNYVGFSQQSGAVGLDSNLSVLARFPASQPYDKLKTLKYKLNSLPFNVSVVGENKKYIYSYQELKSVSFSVEVTDFKRSQLSCYITGIGKQPLNWQSQSTFTINFTEPLPVGRVRSNCTAPSLTKPGRFYWHSHPWFILNAVGDWYPL